MRTRHKIPSIFNLSMVDVLCCALGCVILLWLLNFREAKRKAAVAGEASTQLTQARAQLDIANAEAAEYRQQLATIEDRLKQAEGRFLATVKERERLGEEVATARSRLAAMSKDNATLKADRGAADDRVAALKADKILVEDKLLKRNQEYLALSKDKDALLMLLREKELLAKAAARSADDLAEKLRESEGRAKKAQGLTELAQGYREKLAAAENKASTLEKELGNQRRLTDQANRGRIAAENRFAGITLTGRRVVFLVDMSGSMDYVDEKTPDANKWLGVRESLAKIARSLPDLEKFQVIVFSDKASYLMGNDDGWIDFDSRTSVDKTLQSLAATKPRGNTNMYAAFEAAFKLRSDGLDTIYLLSDGLPNVGAGLPLDKARTMTEVERSGVLSQHVLKTLRGTWNRPAADKSRVRIHAVGFFYESPDVGAFLWALARENDGSFVGMSKP